MPRRALCIGVGSFVPSGQSLAEEPELTPFAPLEYAAGCAQELCSALEAAGYDTELITDPAELTAARVGGHVERYLTGGGVAVVHALSHGEHTADGGVYVVGSDGCRSSRTRIEDWRIAVTDDATAPMTLFLMDLCHAGAANRYWRPPLAGSRERAWVIAAAGADKPAYAGRLTRAATSVIREISSGRADLAHTLPFVKFDMFFERVRRRMAQLAEDEGGYLQDPVCTPVMGGQPELPFFPNPDFVPSVAADAAASVEPETAMFVDPVLDDEHFRSRAAGHWPAGRRFIGGCFAGRAPQLRRLTEWMDNRNLGEDSDGTGNGLVVVTGSPGAGKSALLGVLVCAAHPKLRNSTRDLWHTAAFRPSQNQHLAAVHARQRTLTEITKSLGRQLLNPVDMLHDEHNAAGGGEADLGGQYTPSDLIAALGELAVRPLIVLDALDEAYGHQQILDQLLLPLARARRADGSSACRLLIGTRPWDEFNSLFALAGEIGEVLDLDAIPLEQRRNDVVDYVTRILELLPGYDEDTHSQGRRAFAGAIAAALIPDGPTSRTNPSTDTDGSDEMRWGEFLVAALYTHTVTLGNPNQMLDRHSAATLGTAVPRSLPEVLELDLATRPPGRWRRPLLAALARARGNGVPRSLLPALVAATADKSMHPPLEDVAHDLEQLRFYLRIGTESDGAALYRLFHQGLADHVRTRSSTALGNHGRRILDHLLATIPVDDSNTRLWDLAAPYLRRHAIQHAASAASVDELVVDPGFLVHADPATLIPILDSAEGTKAQIAAAVYRVSADRHAEEAPTRRRDVLSIDATRFAAPDLRDALSLVPPRAKWSPRWATASQVSTAFEAAIEGAGIAEAIGCTTVNGRPVAVTGGWDGTVRIWDLTSRSLVGEPLVGHTGRVTAVACTDINDTPVAVTTGHDKTVRIWDLVRHSQVGQPLVGHTGRVTAVACTHVGDTPVAVTAGWEGTVRIWDLVVRSQIGKPLTGEAGDFTAVTCSVLDGCPVVLAAEGDNTLRMWNLVSRSQVGEPLVGHTARVTAVASTILNGRPVGVTTGWDRTVRIWDLATGTSIGGPVIGHTRAVTAVACTVSNEHPIVVTAGRDGAIRVWDQDTGAPIGEPLHGHVRDVKGVACAIVDGRPVSISAGLDGTVRIWDLINSSQIGEPLIGHTSAVTAVACTKLDGSPVAVSTSWDGTARVWDLVGRSQVGAPLIGHTGRVTAVACTSLNGVPVAITTGNDHTVRIWDVSSCSQIGEPLNGHLNAVTAVACTEINGSPVAVSASWDRTVRIWDLSDRSQIGGPLIGHAGRVTAVACTDLDGAPTAVTASWDGTLRTWDLLSHRALGRIDLPTSAPAVAVGAGNAVAAGFGWDVVVLERVPEKFGSSPHGWSAAARPAR